MTASGVVAVPQTIIRLRSVKDFSKDEAKVETSLPLSIFPIKSLLAEQADHRSTYLQMRVEEEHYHGRVQCALHMACSLLTLISTLNEVKLPYRLQQQALGFEIHDSAGVRYPLYLLREAPLADNDKNEQR